MDIKATITNAIKQICVNVLCCGLKSVINQLCCQMHYDDINFTSTGHHRCLVMHLIQYPSEAMTNERGRMPPCKTTHVVLETRLTHLIGPNETSKTDKKTLHPCA